VKRALVAHGGRTMWVAALDDKTRLLTGDGKEINAAEVVWLPPVTPGASVFALGLNYADHNAELGFSKKSEAP
jgi:5-oxopent-3-ene-1,2,5-tricarboxylate decarboxylase/2-hydroxyhepta-2,4-diene-1,7-dioate isomerase